MVTCGEHNYLDVNATIWLGINHKICDYYIAI